MFDFDNDFNRKKIDQFCYVYHKNGFNYLAFIKKEDKRYYYLCRWDPCSRQWSYREVNRDNVKHVECFRPNPC